MLAQLFRRLLRLDSRNPPEPASWWIKAYEEAAIDRRFGPTERRELDLLAVDLQRHFPNPGGYPFWLEYTTLHGYLCCIVIGPRRALSTTHWLSELLGDLPDEPTAEYLRLLALMRRLAADIQKDFARTKPQLRLPALDVNQGPPTKKPGPKLSPLKYWCASFLLATELQPTRWLKVGSPNPATGDLLEHLWAIGTPEGQQDQVDFVYRQHRRTGWTEKEAQEMVQGFSRRETQPEMLAGLRRDLKDIWVYWDERR